MVRNKREKVGRQLDYALVSSRWKSYVVSCRPKWAPSIRRSLHGDKSDHALVECMWTWRVRTEKKKKCKDFSVLYAQETDEQGKPVLNKAMQQFEEVVKQKSEELGFGLADTTAAMYAILCKAIQHAVDTVLSDTVRKNGVRRDVSEKTQSLFDERTKLRGQGTQEQYDSVQSRIKESSLADFQGWVDKCADNINEANMRGDTKTIYQGVKVLAQKHDKPSPNLTTDHQGVTLKCAEDVARAWHRFLKAKFSATEREEDDRPPMEDLPCTQGAEPLPKECFLRGLTKMANGKACGPDAIPAELYKRSKVCRDMLQRLIQQI